VHREGGNIVGISPPKVVNGLAQDPIDDWLGNSVWLEISRIKSWTSIPLTTVSSLSITGTGSPRYTVICTAVSLSVGQTVAAHTQIGFLGSSGRSSGPHVHYEVLVNGEPHDPEKFIGLGHLIPVTER
jgi:hypothetical protein